MFAFHRQIYLTKNERKKSEQIKLNKKEKSMKKFPDNATKKNFNKFNFYISLFGNKEKENPLLFCYFEFK